MIPFLQRIIFAVTISLQFQVGTSQININYTDVEQIAHNCAVRGTCHEMTWVKCAYDGTTNETELSNISPICLASACPMVISGAMEEECLPNFECENFYKSIEKIAGPSFDRACEAQKKTLLPGGRKCADEGGTCDCIGKVKFGWPYSGYSFPVELNETHHSIECNQENFDVSVVMARFDHEAIAGPECYCQQTCGAYNVDMQPAGIYQWLDSAACCPEMETVWWYLLCSPFMNIFEDAPWPFAVFLSDTGRGKRFLEEQCSADGAPAIPDRLEFGKTLLDLCTPNLRECVEHTQEVTLAFSTIFNLYDWEMREVQRAIQTICDSEFVKNGDPDDEARPILKYWTPPPGELDQPINSIKITFNEVVQGGALGGSLELRLNKGTRQYISWDDPGMIFLENTVTYMGGDIAGSSDCLEAKVMSTFVADRNSNLYTYHHPNDFLEVCVSDVVRPIILTITPPDGSTLEYGELGRAGIVIRFSEPVSERYGPAKLLVDNQPFDGYAHNGRTLVLSPDALKEIGETQGLHYVSIPAELFADISDNFFVRLF